MKILYYLVTLCNSFATMSGAMLLATLATEYTGEDIYAQSFTMGPYLLGLGLGSGWADKFPQELRLNWLWRLEITSLLTIALMPLLFFSAIFIFTHTMPFEVGLDGSQALRFILCLTTALGLMMGLLGGAQFPLLLQLPHRIKEEFLVMVNYLGPLLALGLLLSSEYFSLPHWHQVSLIVSVQFFGLLMLNYILRERKTFYLTLAILIPLVLINSGHNRVEGLLIKSSYLSIRASIGKWETLQNLVRFLDSYAELERVKTPYQTIDLLIEPPDLQLSQPGNATVFLNRKPQFDLTTADVYHQTMVEAAINLMPSPHTILILGAGDGLLLNEWLPRSFTKLVMVELDPVMLAWSAKHPIMKELNKKSLVKLDSRVKIVIDDAIHFLKNNNEKFDLVLIDFPFPNSVDLAKLYSHEFYSLVRRAMSPQGLMILDLPILQNAQGILALESQTILRTLDFAEFKNPLVFGPHASFVALTKDQRSLRFDYSRMPNVKLKTKLNLVPIINQIDFSQGEINSMMRPRVL